MIDEDNKTIYSQFWPIQKLSKKWVDKLKIIQKKYRIKKVDIYARLLYKEKYVNLPVFSILSKNL